MQIEEGREGGVQEEEDLRLPALEGDFSLTFSCDWSSEVVSMVSESFSEAETRRASCGGISESQEDSRGQNRDDSSILLDPRNRINDSENLGAIGQRGGPKRNSRAAPPHRP